jgi:hypothetical protein
MGPLGYRSLVCVAIVLVAACKKERPPATELPAIVEVRDRITGALIPLDAMPPEVLDHAAKLSAEQAVGLDNAQVAVKRAWNYQGPATIVANPGFKLVAMELRFTSIKWRFDPDDLDIIDAADGQNYGSDPQLQRVTWKGEAVGWEDPMFKPDDDLQIIAVWGVPTATQRVKVGYWGATITPTFTLDASGPVLPERTEAVVGYAVAGLAPDGSTRHLLLIQCSCARSENAPYFAVVDAAGHTLDELRTIEVDAALLPISGDPMSRPLWGTRRWIVEQWGKVAKEINQFGKRTPLPATIKPPTALLTALDRIAPDEVGLEMHRRGN